MNVKIKQFSGRGSKTRRGSILVLGVLCLVLLLVFTGFSVDLGMITITKSRIQSAADAASLAAAQRITSAIKEYSKQGGSGQSVQSIQSYAMDEARKTAKEIVEANGFHIDPSSDVRFGKRVSSGGSWSVQWGATPANCVEVTIMKDNPDTSAPDGKLPLMFGPLGGERATQIGATSTAFIESRDIVAVLDFSGSMNYDSLPYKSGLDQSNIQDNLDDIWDALVISQVTFSDDTSTVKFPMTGFGKIDSVDGVYKYASTSDTFDFLELGEQTANGVTTYVPYPQEGKTSSGYLKGKPSPSTSESKWQSYISWVRNYSSRGKLNGSGFDYRYRYGYRTLMMYMLHSERENDESEDLWRVPAYPFQAVKDGMSTFLDFLDGLEFQDHVGFVNYGTEAVRETGLDDDGAPVTIDLKGNHLTTNYEAIDAIQRHKQASHYSGTTNIGAGVREARTLLDEQGRPGSRWQILLMTDGAVNSPSSIPSGMPPGWNQFDWDELTDWDNDGAANYDSNDIHSNSFEGYYPDQKLYLFYQAKMAVESGITIHTMSVGDGADSKLMKAIAHMGGGVYIRVDGGSKIEDIKGELQIEFNTLAGNVPPARLLRNE